LALDHEQRASHCAVVVSVWRFSCAPSNLFFSLFRSHSFHTKGRNVFPSPFHSSAMSVSPRSPTARLECQRLVRGAANYCGLLGVMSRRRSTHRPGLLTPSRRHVLSSYPPPPSHHSTHNNTPTKDVGPPFLLCCCHICRQAHVFECHCFRPCPTGCLRHCRHLQPQCLHQGKADTVNSTIKHYDRPFARSRLKITPN
jgi:hypothetical protein